MLEEPYILFGKLYFFLLDETVDFGDGINVLPRCFKIDIEVFLILSDEGEGTEKKQL